MNDLHAILTQYPKNTEMQEISYQLFIQYEKKLPDELWDYIVNDVEGSDSSWAHIVVGINRFKCKELLEARSRLQKGR